MKNFAVFGLVCGLIFLPSAIANNFPDYKKSKASSFTRSHLILAQSSEDIIKACKTGCAALSSSPAEYAACVKACIGN